jgi:hypothetical protein
MTITDGKASSTTRPVVTATDAQIIDAIVHGLKHADVRGHSPILPSVFSHRRTVIVFCDISGDEMRRSLRGTESLGDYQKATIDLTVNDDNGDELEHHFDRLARAAVKQLPPSFVVEFTVEVHLGWHCLRRDNDLDAIFVVANKKVLK